MTCEVAFLALSYCAEQSFPQEGAILDARPMRAKMQALALGARPLLGILPPSVLDATGPQQLGVGVSVFQGELNN